MARQPDQAPPAAAREEKIKPRTGETYDDSPVTDPDSEAEAYELYQDLAREEIEQMDAQLEAFRTALGPIYTEISARLDGREAEAILVEVWRWSDEIDQAAKVVDPERTELRRIAQRRSGPQLHTLQQLYIRICKLFTQLRDEALKVEEPQPPDEKGNLYLSRRLHRVFLPSLRESIRSFMEAKLPPPGWEYRFDRVPDVRNRAMWTLDERFREFGVRQADSDIWIAKISNALWGTTFTPTERSRAKHRDGKKVSRGCAAVRRRIRRFDEKVEAARQKERRKTPPKGSRKR